MLHRATALAGALALLLPLGASVAPATAPGQGSFEPGFAEQLRADPDAETLALLSVDLPVGGTFQAKGLRVLRAFDFGVVLVQGKAMALLRTADVPGVRSIASTDPLEWHLATATVATRARETWDAKSTSTNPLVLDGRVVDGTSVGIAIVDTGIDATHPDLADAMAKNLRFVCTTPFVSSPNTSTCYGNALLGSIGCGPFDWVDLPDADVAGGHGTHVAGIAAGRGVASDGRFMGAAPGATVYGLGVGDALSPVYVLEAFQWVLCHHATVDPPIRIVSNSWGDPGDFDPLAPVSRAVDALVDAGLVVVFSVGNAGGDGDEDTVNALAKDPKPGVIAVANYNDAGRATRNGDTDLSSSCGLSTDSNRDHWPDVAAPGTDITAPWAKGGALLFGLPEQAYLPHYISATGTSMAAPHVAGIAALLLQAHPGLSPAQVEDLLEDSAVQFVQGGPYLPDAANPDAGTNWCAGHGLVDAVAALERALGQQGLGSPLPRTSQQPHVYFQGLDFEVLSGVQWTVPRGLQVGLSERSLESGDPARYPLVAGMPALFSVSCPGALGLAFASVSADALGGVRMDAQSSFQAFGLPGVACTVDSQVDYDGDGAYTSFDRFVVRVV